MSSLAILLLLACIILVAGLLVALATVFRLRAEREHLAAVMGADSADSIEQTVMRMKSRVDEAGDLATLKVRLTRMLIDLPLPALLLDEKRLIIELSARAEEELDQPRRRRGLLETLGSHELDEAAQQAMASLKPSAVTVRLYSSGRHTYQARLFPYRAGDGIECLIFLQDVAATMDFGELRSQFAATVSHELRTPLAGIRAMVESLQDPAISPEEASRFLGRIGQETQRLGHLIDEILFLSSLESGATESIAGETEVLAVSERVSEKLQPAASQFDITIRNSIQPGLMMPLSERMAATVLSNLIENAIKYSGRGSHIDLSAVREDGRLKVVVLDDGIGIDAEHLPHVFERFYRVDKSRSRRLGGTGLGLSIVKHIVESAGGETAIKSREGFGTEITLTFPTGTPY